LGPIRLTRELRIVFCLFLAPRDINLTM
jgi:hypothetical protein